MAARKLGTRKRSIGSKVGKTGTKVGTKPPGKPPAEAHPATGKPPKTIRMLMSLANQHRSYVNGSVYRVPQECPVPTARSWVASGAAEMVTE